MSVLGILAALAVTELALRPFASAWHEKPLTRPAEIRQYYEGISSARFLEGGERATANPPVPGAPHLLILGDSHVAALQVSDQETMGSVLERRARAAGESVNVHQFGWVNEAAPFYALKAPALLQRFDPVRVVVVLSPFDIRDELLQGRVRAQIAADGSVRVVEDGAIAVRPSWQERLGQPVISHSVLAYHLYRATQLMREAARLSDTDAAEGSGPPARLEELILMNLWLLKSAYGARLLILYDPHLTGLHTSARDDGGIERALLLACQQQEVDCVTTRADFVRDRHARERLARGFGNTAPGVGHWNATGHQIIADVIWQHLNSRPGRR